MKINIITSSGLDWFSRQLSDEEKVQHEISVNSKADEVWDLVVVYENLLKPYQVKCKKGGFVFISGEPPLSSVYPKSFLNQFDCILSSHSRLSGNNVRSQQSLPWMIGLNRKDNTYSLKYDDFLTNEFSDKAKIISIICSFKTMMPGHRKRNDLMNALMQKYGNKIDYYGSGFNFIDDKQDAIVPFKFHICIENSSIPNYWTEKLIDPILGLAVPIYIGCTNIDEYFDTSCMFVCSLDDTQRIFDVIDSIFDDPQRIYEEKRKSLLVARDRILKEYNIIPTITKLSNALMITNEVEEVLIKPKTECSGYKTQYFWMQCKRKFKRNFAQ